MKIIKATGVAIMVLLSTGAFADQPVAEKTQVENRSLGSTSLSDHEMISLVATLNNPEVQRRILDVARAAVLEQIKKEGVSVTPEMLARIATANTKQNRDAAETLAAGAVFIATVGIFSDSRLKHDIVQVGKSLSGINIYEFSYVGHSSRWKGVLAQELLASRPDAVFQDQSGYLVVDYSKIDVPFSKP